MKLVIFILVVFVIALGAVIQYYRLMLLKEMKEKEGIENLIENYEVRIEMLQKELKSEIRMQQVWRERATIAWHNGYRYDAVDTYKGYNNTFGVKAINEIMEEQQKQEEADEQYMEVG